MRSTGPFMTWPLLLFPLSVSAAFPCSAPPQHTSPLEVDELGCTVSVCQSLSYPRASTHAGSPPRTFLYLSSD